MKGGARVRSGPAPDPHAQRRDRPDDRDWLDLPASGREGDPPPWPLVRPTGRERAVWAELWQRPIAITWERAGEVEHVAAYVRCLVRAERNAGNATLWRLVHQMMDALGLTADGLLKRRCRVVAATEEIRAATGTEGPSVKDRFRSIPGGLP